MAQSIHRVTFVELTIDKVGLLPSLPFTDVDLVSESLLVQDLNLKCLPINPGMAATGGVRRWARPRDGKEETVA